MKFKNRITILLLLGLMSCSVNTQVIDKVSEDVKIVKLNQPILKNKEQEKEQHLNINVGQAKSGASFSIKIDLSNSFKTKANINGSLAKTPNDIQSYEIFLIKNINSIYPVNGDPIGDKVSGPFVINANGETSTSITFNNVGDSQGQYYFVALRALDGANASGNNLIKVNNNWTGTTSSAPYNNQVAVSNSGVTVSPTFVINPTTTLIITPQLVDGVGAKLDSSISVNNGVLPNVSLNIANYFRVNTFTTSDQRNPSIAIDNTGNFVISWESRDQEGNYYEVYAQRYNSSGVKQNSEFRVNSYTKNSQSEPSISMNASGNFVITWQSDQDGNNVGVYAQRYNSSGIPQGSEFRVNTYTTSFQGEPSVAMDSTGNFIITWESNYQDGSGYGIYAQRYNNLGIAQGSEFRVNSYTTGLQSSPTVAVNSSGNFVITWSGKGTGDNDSGIYAKVYNSSGISQGAEFRVNTYTTNDQARSKIAIDNNGNFIIAWNSRNQESVTSSNDIYGQRFNLSGISLGKEFKVNTYTTNEQLLPSVAMDSAGNFIVTWKSNNQNGNAWGIYAQKFNNEGEIQGSEFRVNVFNLDNHINQISPSIVIAPDGNFVISWTSFNEDGSNDGIYAKRFSKIL